MQTKGIDHRHDVVEAAGSVFGIGSTQLWNGTDGTGDRLRFTYPAGFDDDVVETLHFHQFENLFDEVGAERTADATVLQGHEAVFLLAYDTAFLNQFRIDVDFTDVVHDDGKLDSFTVTQQIIQ